LVLQYKILCVVKFIVSGDFMTDVERALSQIAEIRAQMAAGTRFLGFAPQAVGLTALLALATGTAQSFWPEALAADSETYLATWIVTAVAACTIIAGEALTRSRQFHGVMADSMINGTLRQFLPFGAAGAAIGFVLWRVAPESLWLLPGLWQILVSLMAFAAAATLPRSIIWAAGWYFVSGTVVLLLAARSGLTSPWLMAGPFAIGQLLTAAILHQSNEARDD
jgi:hypothetical protein